MAIWLSWFKLRKKERKAKTTPLCLPPEIWLHIVSYLPPPEEWTKTKLYRVNGTFLDCYIRQRYQDIQLFNPVPGLEGFSTTQFQDEQLTRRNMAVLRDTRRSKVVKTLRIRFKVQYFDYHREAAEPENLEMALRSYLELIREGQNVPCRTSLGDTPRIYLPSLSKLTLDLSKAIGFRADPAKLLDKSLREHVHPFLLAHANLITTFSFSTPQDEPRIGDACLLHLPNFPSLKALSIRVFSDQASTWDGASQFLRHHSTRLEQLKITLTPRIISERPSRDNSALPIPSQDWTGQLFWAVPMPALTEFQLWAKVLPTAVDGVRSLDRQLPKSITLLERLILSAPLANPLDLKKLICHLGASNNTHPLKELFIPKVELDHLGLTILARGFPRLQRLSVHSIDLNFIVGTSIDAASDALSAHGVQPCNEWELERLDFTQFPASHGDSLERCRHALAALLPNVSMFQGVDRVEWLDKRS